MFKTDICFTKLLFVLTNLIAWHLEYIYPSHYISILFISIFIIWFNIKYQHNKTNQCLYSCLIIMVMLLLYTTPLIRGPVNFINKYLILCNQLLIKPPYFILSIYQHDIIMSFLHPMLVTRLSHTNFLLTQLGLMHLVCISGAHVWIISHLCNQIPYISKRSNIILVVIITIFFGHIKYASVRALAAYIYSCSKLHAPNKDPVYALSLVSIVWVVLHIAPISIGDIMSFFMSFSILTWHSIIIALPLHIQYTYFHILLYTSSMILEACCQLPTSPLKLISNLIFAGPFIISSFIGVFLFICPIYIPYCIWSSHKYITYHLVYNMDKVYSLFPYMLYIPQTYGIILYTSFVIISLIYYYIHNTVNKSNYTHTYAQYLEYF